MDYYCRAYEAIHRAAMLFCCFGALFAISGCNGMAQRPEVTTLGTIDPDLAHSLADGTMFCTNYDGSDIRLVTFPSGRQVKFSLGQFGLSGADISAIAGPRAGRFLMAMGLDGIICGQVSPSGVVTLSRTKLGMDVSGVAFGSEPDQFYFLGNNRGAQPKLYSINLKTKAKEEISSFGAYPARLDSTSSGRYVLVLCNSSICIIDGRSKRVVRTLREADDASSVPNAGDMIFANSFLDLSATKQGGLAMSGFKKLIKDPAKPLLKVLRSGAYFFQEPDGDRLETTSAGDLSIKPHEIPSNVLVTIAATTSGERKSGAPTSIFLHYNGKEQPIVCYKGARGKVFFSYDH